MAHKLPVLHGEVVQVHHDIGHGFVELEAYFPGVWKRNVEETPLARRAYTCMENNRTALHIWRHLRKPGLWRNKKTRRLIRAWTFYLI